MPHSEKIKSAAQAAINVIIQQVKGAKAVVISTGDGFEVAAHAENNAQVSRMSAMASSLSALGVLAGEESRLGSCKNILIEAEAGILLILQVQSEHDTWIMSVIAGNDAVVGQVLFFARQAASNLQDL